MTTSPTRGTTRGRRARRPDLESSITLTSTTLTIGGRIFGQVVSRVRLEGAVDQISATAR